ncbi:MAG: MCE family protein, partial [Microvirga sp.]
DRFLEQVGQAAQRIGPLAEKLETLATDIDEVVRSVDRQRVARIVENVDSFTATLGDNRQALGEALRDAASLVSRLNETAPKFDAAIADVGNLAKSIDAAKVGRTVDNVDKFTQSLGARTEDVDKTIQEARSIAEKLNKSADRVDNVLKAAESFLGSAAGEEGRSTFEEIRNAARAVRELAANLDQRSTGVLAGLGRFTDSGLREYQALAADGRKALNDVSRAFRALERSPQQFIFGGRPSIPEYSGRR